MQAKMKMTLSNCSSARRDSRRHSRFCCSALLHCCSARFCFSFILLQCTILLHCCSARHSRFCCTAFAFAAQTVEPLSNPTSNTITVAGLPTGVPTVLTFGCSPTMSSNGGAQMNGNGNNPGSNNLQCPSTLASASGGSYASLVAISINGVAVTSLAPGGNMVQILDNAPITLNAGITVGTSGLCQLVVQNGDTVTLSVPSPGNAGVVGLVQSIPVSIGTQLAYWAVTVRSPSIGLAQGPNAPACPDTCPAGNAAGVCNGLSSFSSGAKGDTNSLYYAIPFQPSAAFTLNYAVVGVMPFGPPSSIVLPDSVSIVTDASGLPSTTQLASTTTLFNTNPSMWRSTAASLFGVCTSQPGSTTNCSTASMVSGTGRTISMATVEQLAIEAAFTSPASLSASTKYWLLVHFPANTGMFQVIGSGALSSAGALVPKLAGAAKSWSSLSMDGTNNPCGPLLYLLA